MLGGSHLFRIFLTEVYFSRAENWKAEFVIEELGEYRFASCGAMNVY